MTPLQLFVQSLLPSAVSYDLCSKVMRVFNLPSGSTAQQLYELFHSYYPSVYRIEVKNGEREEGENSDSGSNVCDGMYVLHVCGVCACVHACVRVCVCACMCVCVHVSVCV